MMNRFRMLLVSGAMFALAIQVAAQNQHANQSRGFEADGVYSSGDINSVNVFNGNLILSVPIGRTYKVGANLTYALNLFYNSNLWTHKEACVEEIAINTQYFHVWTYTYTHPNGDQTTWREPIQFYDLDNPEPRLARRDGCWTVAHPNPVTNAGMGWQMTLGRLFLPRTDSSDLTNPHPLKTESGQFVYQSPHGSEHTFYPTLHATDPAGSPNISYTRDNSYLRKKVTGNLHLIEFPNGEVHTFKPVDGSPGEMELIQMRDVFGNALNISYERFSNGKYRTWTLTDTHGRTQRITFEVLAPQYQSVARKVELTAFGGATSVYTFEYEVREIKRAAPHTADQTNRATISVPFLKTIKLPDQSTYSMAPINTSYAVSDETEYARQRGIIRGITLPTGARREWDYGGYQFSYLSSGRGYQDVSLGVKTRRTIEGGARREWTYTPKLEPQPANSNEGKSCLVDTESVKPECGVRELIVLERTPLGHYTRHYFSVYAHPLFRRTEGRNPDDWHISEYGLPLTKYQSAVASAGKRVFLSRQTFVDANAEANNDPLRSVYLRYETDTIPEENGFGSSVEDLNRRVVAGRTVFHDDDEGGEKFADVVYDNFDGLGHYRTTNSYGNFERGDGTGAQRGQVGDLRINITNYNPPRRKYSVSTETNAPAVDNNYVPFPESEPWVLGTYDTVTAGDYNNRSTTYFYFNNVGQLRRKRIRSAYEKANTDYLLGDNDVLVEYDYGAGGTLTGERYYGGDLRHDLPHTWPLQDVNLPGAPEYHITHDYEFGVLKKSQYAGAPYLSVDNDINARTGLVRASRDQSQNQTDYLYDTSGRVTRIAPRQGSRTDIVYTRLNQALPVGQLGSSADTPQAASAGPAVNIFRRNSAGTAVLDEERYDYDTLGRLRTETKLMPAGGISRTTLYNEVGWKKSVSEWGAPGKKTEYFGYDAFGRPGVVRPADGAGHDITFRYRGEREMQRKMKVGTKPLFGSVVEFESQRVETYDRLGRLRSVTEPSGPGATEVTTYYNCDVGGHLTKVRTPASPVAGAAEVTQARDFEYDNRGFLLSEKLPELGAGGNGKITYSRYDTVGNVGTRVDGTRDLRFDYDSAGRATLVEERGPSGAYRPLKNYAYYGANNTAANNYRLGKLHVATRHNYVINPASGAEIDVQVNEVQTYMGLNGNLSHKTTVLNSTHPTPPTFNQSFSYDELGNLSGQTYPQCVNTTCASSGMAVPRAVSYVRGKGILTKVTGGGFDYASSISYHGNGMVNAITYGNNVVLTHGKDPNSMPRPASIATSGVGGTNTNWNSGPYTYDGSGNVTGIGSDWYAYDAVGRVVEGTALSAPGRKQTYGYDAFGNLRSISTYHGVTTSGATLEGVQNLDVNAGTNRVNGVSYDSSGNMLGLPADNPKPYSYDSLNRQKTAPGKTFIYTAGDERVWIIDHSSASWAETLTLRGLNNEVLREYHILGGTAPATGSGARTMSMPTASCWRRNRRRAGSSTTPTTSAPRAWSRTPPPSASHRTSTSPSGSRRHGPGRAPRG